MIKITLVRKAFFSVGLIGLAACNATSSAMRSPDLGDNENPTILANANTQALS